MTVAPSLSLPHLNLHSSFLCCPLKSFSCKPSATTTIQAKPTSYPRIRALELDQNTVVAKTEYMECKFSKRRNTSTLEVKVGDHNIPQVSRFKYLGCIIQSDGEIEGDVNHRIQSGWLKWRKASGVLCGKKSKRDNTQPCFPCNGSGAQKCRFCLGTGNVTVELGGDEKEVSRCINCDGAGSLTCTTCQGSGIQPRYLDRREFKDDD